jgi:UDP-arabinose 4-epimerase
MPGAILVTGGAGFIGSHVCKLLAQSGYLPVTYDSLVRGFADAVRWGPLEIGDLMDGARLGAVMEKYRPRAVIHLGGLIAVGESVVDPGPYYSANVAGSVVLCEAMRQAGIHHIVFSSSAAVYGMPKKQPIAETAPTSPINPYGHTKLMIERLLGDYGAAYGLHWVALRYFNAAGSDPDAEIGERHQPETHLIPLLLDAAADPERVIDIFGDDYPTPDGSCVRDYVHVCDLAAAHLLAVDWLLGDGGSQVFNLGTGRGTSVAEVIDAARRVTGRPINVRIRPRRAGDPPTLVSDPSRAMSRLGWHPQFTDIADFIAHAWRFRHPKLSLAAFEDLPVIGQGVA